MKEDIYNKTKIVYFCSLLHLWYQTVSNLIAFNKNLLHEKLNKGKNKGLLKAYPANVKNLV